MEAVARMVDKLKTYSDMGHWVNKVVKSFEKQIVNMVTKGQIYKGNMPDDTAIRPLDKTYPVYSSIYEMYKSQLGKYQGHVDLSLSGQFLQSFHIDYESDGFTIQAGERVADGDNITETLRFRYGDFEGLNDANMDKLVEIVKHGLIIELRKAIGI